MRKSFLYVRQDAIPTTEMEAYAFLLCGHLLVKFNVLSNVTSYAIEIGYFLPGGNWEVGKGQA